MPQKKSGIVIEIQYLEQFKIEYGLRVDIVRTKGKNEKRVERD